MRRRAPGRISTAPCVDAVSGESDNVNNCSEAVSMTITAVSGTTKLYWTDFNKRKVQSSNLDGSVVRDLVTAGLVGPFGIALDMFAGKMYWTDVGYGQNPAVQPRRQQCGRPRHYRLAGSIRHRAG